MHALITFSPESQLAIFDQKNTFYEFNSSYLKQMLKKLESPF
jgi:hypothetical protein